MDNSKLVSHSLAGQHYGYSAADLGDLGADSYTLVTIIVDESGSTARFKTEMEKCIQEVIESCKASPRSDYLMVRLITFNSDMREIHGFKQLPDIDISDYNNCLNPGGLTLLFETVKNAIDATAAYAKDLASQDYEVNSLISIISDGLDNQSGSIDSASVGKSLQDAMMAEDLESIVTILIGVGVGDYQDISDSLDTFKDEAGLSQYIELKDAKAHTLAKLADFISKSVSQQSTSLGTGSASTPLAF